METRDPILGMDRSNAEVGAAHRRLLAHIAEAARRGLWRGTGARDMAHYVWMRLGISDWKARRWVAAAHALERLPAIAEALTTGELCIDKVVELTRFAGPDDEGRLIAWAKRVSCGAIRHRADRASRALREETLEAERDRRLAWWYEGRRFGLLAELPAAAGAVVARAIERLAETVPPMPGDDGPYPAEARRADALVALCSGAIAADPDPDRATVVVHARAEALLWGAEGAEIEGGPAIAPETARRLACNARIQVLFEDASGDPIRVGRVLREPPAWMLRQLRYRDRECRFPGCGARRFTHAHHIVWWEKGGATTLDNLILVCAFHHRLVHEHGWTVRREEDGTVSWFFPNGTRYRAGPARAEPPVVPPAPVTGRLAS